jgi:hypothetical protein
MHASLAMFVKLPSGVRLARMSSGTWCLVRDLGLVKGGKGMRHFDPVVTFSFRALLKYLRNLPQRQAGEEDAERLQDIR